MLNRFILMAALLFATAIASSQTCRWDGTAPFCSGSCRGGESEAMRLSSLPDHWQDAFPGIQNTDFGEACWTGSKALCCPSAAGSECRWDGTAPFCGGACGAGERRRDPPPGSYSGAACVTGRKVYCCRENTAQSRSALSTNANLTTYAGLWDKSPAPQWQARHGLTSAQYQQTFDQLTRQGFRPVIVRGYSLNGVPRFAAVFENRPGPAFVARHDISAAAYQQEFDRLTRQGYRPVDLSGFSTAAGDRYTAVFEQTGGPPFRAFHGITSARYQAEFDQALRDGFRPVLVSGYSVNGQDRFAAVFEQRAGPVFVARHGITSSQYQQLFNELGPQGYRPTRLSSWVSRGTPRYAVIWEKAEGAAWQARHNMFEDRYQEEFDKLTKEGYRLRDVSAYHAYN